MLENWKVCGNLAVMAALWHAGQVCATLRLGLGEYPHQQYQEQKLNKKVSPCQQRRRDRRAEANENDLNVRNKATKPLR